jgi:hypothetical protein
MLGYRLALTTRINEDSHHHEHVTSLREGLFVLLALLLGWILTPTGRLFSANFWQEVVAVTQQNQKLIVTTYLQSLNATIDLAETRLAVF